MMKKLINIFCILGLVLTIAACQKKEEQPLPKTAMQSPMATPSDLSQPMKSSDAMPAQGSMPASHGSMGAPKKIEVPDDVKKSWKRVTLVFADKKTRKTADYTVDVNSKFDIQGTDLKVAVGDFLPDFKMIGSNITSGSNETVNPAVRVEIFEKGQSIFKGWLFAKMPEIHPFESDKYGLVLKGGIKNK